MVEILEGASRHFGVRIEDEAAKDFVHVHDLVGYISRRLGQTTPELDDLVQPAHGHALAGVPERLELVVPRLPEQLGDLELQGRVARATP